MKLSHGVEMTGGIAEMATLEVEMTEYYLTFRVCDSPLLSFQLLSFQPREATLVIPNPVPNPSTSLRACPERSVGINSCEGACEESCWFQNDRRNGRKTVTL